MLTRIKPQIGFKWCIALFKGTLGSSCFVNHLISWVGAVVMQITGQRARSPIFTRLYGIPKISPF